MAARYISHHYGAGVAGGRSRGSSVLRESCGSTINQQTRETSAFYSSQRSASAPRSSSRARSGTPGGRRGYTPPPPSNAGFTKSLSQREPLFTDFVTSQAAPGSSLYNSGNMTELKDRFRDSVQDQWDRRSRGDPAVHHDIALRTHGWSNYLTKSSTSASESLGRKHSASRLQTSREMADALMPRITVYHRSTLL